MKKLFVTGFFIAAIAIIAGCRYDKADVVYPHHQPCDTSNVRLSVELKAILTASCFDCHSGNAANGAGIKLDNYNTISALALGDILMPALNHTGTSKMPKGGSKLPQCDIDKFQAWVNAGAPQN